MILITFPLPTEKTLTTATIMKIIKNVKDWKALAVLIGLRYRQYRFTKLEEHEDAETKKEELISIWCKTHPLASWSLLHQALFMMGESEAAKTIQSQFLKGEESHCCFT